MSDSTSTRHDVPFPLITIDNQDSIREALRRLDLWDDDEKIGQVERAGQGNMNLVLRVVTNRRRLILKQSRPWVEKYPEIAAPADRILVENDFYVRVSSRQVVSSGMPTLLASDPESYLLAMEDLGQASDYSDLYASRQVEAMPLDEAITWLARLHGIEVSEQQRRSVGNRVLRELNHAHMYVIPLQRPSAIGLDEICPGLEELASDVRADSTIHRAAKDLGRRYLDTGPNLLHGDYYPGSWLRTTRGLRVIDPEFAFAGPAEFDLAVLAAHRVLIGGAIDSIEIVTQRYEQVGGASIDPPLVRGFASMEILRRLIGVAQLPLKASLQQRESMIEIARSLLT